MTRRFIVGLLLLLISVGSVFSEEEAGQNRVTIARLKYSGGGDWYYGPTQLPNLIDFIRENSNIPAYYNGKYVELTDDDLFNYPILYMTGHGRIKLSDKEIERLREYLENGGFLLANDDYGLDKSFREMVKRLFPNKELVELPFSHEIYHCFYDFPNGLPKIHEHDGNPPQGFGVFCGGRLVIFYDHESDIGDGWEDPNVYNDPEEKREAALKMGLNIVFYALTH